APHQHGVGRLKIAVARGELQITLDITAADVLGFERAPRNAREGEAVEKAFTTLRNGPRVFALSNKAGCALRDAKAERGQENGSQADGKVHSDISATYRYTCNQIESLRGIDVKLFSLFPKIRRLKVELAGRNTEVMTQVTRKHTRIAF
ncbi:MAG: DUF2796 domain-containing protein, partial [Sulfurifustaceae bacterium]